MKYQEWRSILQKENKTTDEIDKIQMNSECWNTCAVGAKFMCDLEKSGLLPIDKNLCFTIACFMVKDYHIVNDYIYELGYRQFPDLVLGMRWDEALDILDEIYHTTNIYKSDDHKKRLLKCVT